jgi:hypothetical protein
MMPPGHVAITWGMAEVLHAHPTRLDYRLLALAAMAPDLIDKPLAMLVFTQADTSQLIAHSLLLNMVVLLGALLWFRAALPYVLAGNGHLLADRIWNHTETFWWPLYGWNTFWVYKPMGSAQEMAAVYWEIITRYPQVWVVEIIAVAYLAGFAYRRGWYRWPGQMQFWRTGRVDTRG